MCFRSLKVQMARLANTQVVGLTNWETILRTLLGTLSWNKNLKSENFKVSPLTHPTLKRRKEWAVLKTLIEENIV
jgi:hypothetical protein